jgi:hypothetical protein
MLGVFDVTKKADRNNPTIIPFKELLKKLSSKEKASDMTTANRLGGFLSLLTIVNIYKRPRLVVRVKGDLRIHIVAFALFEDLKESLYLMENADGVRPYIRKWYHDVFIKTYNEKIDLNSKVSSRGEILREKRKALTTEELVEKTEEIYARVYTRKQVLETYINPLINHGLVENIESELDKRANIYFPRITRMAKNGKLLENQQTNSFSDQTRIVITDPTIFPDKHHIISEIQQVLDYSKNKDISIKISDHTGKEITVDELVDRYYPNPKDFFELQDQNNDASKLT